MFTLEVAKELLSLASNLEALLTGTVAVTITFVAVTGGQLNHVVAVDSDDAVVENFYLSLKGSGKNITPLVVDISDPAGGRGWANAERSSFVERVRPDLVLCLAVIHHLVISASIPPERVIGFLRSMDAEVILEIPSIDDPMVTLLLDQKTNPEDYRLRYNRDRITRALEREFITVRREEISTRTLLHLTPRP